MTLKRLLRNQDSENTSQEQNSINKRRLSNASVESSEAADLDGAVLVGALSLVDLAGSENARNTGASGKP